MKRIYKCIGPLTVQAINYTDFRVTRFSEKSFIDQALIGVMEEGNFYYLTLSPRDDFKVKAIEPAQIPLRYQHLLEVLSEEEGITDLDALREKAERLHFIKRGTNDFFKSKTAVMTWLVSKYLKTADARMNAEQAKSNVRLDSPQPE